MRRRAATLGFWLTLGCTGLATVEPPPVEPRPSDPIPAPDPARDEAPDPATGTDAEWLDVIVASALQWEVMPGTTAEEDPHRPGELRAFFELHPEYKDAELQARLADLACAFGVEAGHERLTHPTPTEPAVVEVSTDDWRVVVAHADTWCTSDDWSYFTNSVGEAVTAAGITYTYTGAETDVVIVRRGDQELARHALGETGYALLAAEKEPGHVGHEMVENVLPPIGAYFGRSLPAPP